MIKSLTQEQLAAGVTPAAPSLEQHEELNRCAERRLRRAAQKLKAAKFEYGCAMVASCHAKANMAAFIAAQTDDQLVLL